MRVAIIPARGGSKRLPRKNIRPFAGKPILHYPIKAARECLLFDEVIVSTDDAEIARLAIDGGCHRVMHRPAVLADDFATTGQVMRHAVAELIEDLGGYKLEHVCCIYPCTPLLLAADLQAGFNTLVESGKAYVFSVAEYAPQIHRALIRWPDGAVRAVFPNMRDARTQDLDPRYYDAGQWYWGKAESWLKEVPIHDAWSIGHVIPRTRAIDIDTNEDWLMAEALYRTQVANTTRGEA